MIDFDFKLDETSGNNVAELRRVGNSIMSEWVIENKYLHTLMGCPEHDHEQYKRMLSDVEQKYENLRATVQVNQNTNKISSTADGIKVAIQDFEEAYKKITEYTKQHSTLGVLERSLLHRLSEMEHSMEEEVHQMMERATTSIKDTISEGIRDLIGLKSELGLAKEFGGKIKEELAESARKETRFMWSLVGTIFSIPLLNGIVNLLLPDGQEAIRYMLFGSITASLLFISIFLYAQYRTYMMLRLRYTHLDGFLGGGATFISQLLESDNPELKLEVNKKLAELFMSLDDVLTMVNKNKHPTEMTLDAAVKIFDKVNAIKR